MKGMKIPKVLIDLRNVTTIQTTKTPQYYTPFQNSQCIISEAKGNNKMDGYSHVKAATRIFTCSANPGPAVAGAMRERPIVGKCIRHRDAMPRIKCQTALPSERLAVQSLHMRTIILASTFSSSFLFSCYTSSAPTNG